MLALWNSSGRDTRPCMGATQSEKVLTHHKACWSHHQYGRTPNKRPHTLETVPGLRPLFSDNTLHISTSVNPITNMTFQSRHTNEGVVPQFEEVGITKVPSLYPLITPYPLTSLPSPPLPHHHCCSLPTRKPLTRQTYSVQGSVVLGCYKSW